MRGGVTHRVGAHINAAAQSSAICAVCSLKPAKGGQAVQRRKEKTLWCKEASLVHTSGKSGGGGGGGWGVGGGGGENIGTYCMLLADGSPGPCEWDAKTLRLGQRKNPQNADGTQQPSGAQLKVRVDQRSTVSWQP
jgi:hypothetical protein